MKKLTLSLSPLPPFVGVSVDIPLETLLQGVFKQSVETFHVGELVLWCLKEILSDQFTEGDAAGAWSRRYEGYMHFVYGVEEEIPRDMAIRDSISYSGLIGYALNKYRKTYPNEALSKLIFRRLQFLEAYLHRHYNSKLGGFGLARINTRNERNVVVDLRHTIWAVLTLWELGQQNSRTNEVLRRVGAYLNDELRSLDPQNERGITFAVFHRLLTTTGASDVLIIPEVSRVAYVQRLENLLIQKFDESYGSWDLDRDPADTAGIDNALFVLSTVEAGNCSEKRCLDTFRIAVERLCKSSLIEISDDKAGLPFIDGGDPDIGSTLNFLWILWRDRKILGEHREVTKRLLNFVLDPASRDHPGNFAYSWHLVSALSLLCSPEH